MGSIFPGLIIRQITNKMPKVIKSQFAFIYIQKIIKRAWSSTEGFTKIKINKNSFYIQLMSQLLLVKNTWENRENYNGIQLRTVYSIILKRQNYILGTISHQIKEKATYWISLQSLKWQIECIKTKQLIMGDTINQ